MDGSLITSPHTLQQDGQEEEGDATGQAGLPLELMSRIDVVPLPPPYLWVFGAGCVQGCVWGVVAT